MGAIKIKCIIIIIIIVIMITCWLTIHSLGMKNISVMSGMGSKQTHSAALQKIVIIKQAIISNRLSIGCENMCIYLSKQCHR